MTDDEFERKILAELRIDQPSEPEIEADVMPVRFPYFQPGSHEERGTLMPKWARPRRKS